jgi:hypothetical protein
MVVNRGVLAYGKKAETKRELIERSGGICISSPLMRKSHGRRPLIPCRHYKHLKSDTGVSLKLPRTGY